ncbi:MAG TPA: hypothetical protein VIX13_02925 [Candidatus Eisenbacteria bacterium]
MMVEGALAVARLRAGALLLGALAVLIPCAAHADTDGASGPRRDWLALESDAYQPAPVTPERRTLLRRQRPNTISLGIQGSYGMVRGTSRLSDGFSNGPGYAVRFRYMLTPSFALGFSFENQRFNSRGGPPSTTPGASDSTIVMTTVSAEGIFYVHRERESHPYFLGGFGHASPDIVDKSLGSARANEGLYLVLGAGMERFMRPRFSLDFTLRGYAMVSNVEFTSFAQICAGIHLYPGD